MSDEKLNDSNYGTRDKKGHWKPSEPVSVNPPYIYPFKPLKLFKHIFSYPGLIFPWQALFAVITILTWFFLTPPLEQMKNFEIGWVSFIFFRNAIIIFLYTGFFHLWFYVLSKQGGSFKYNPRPLEKNSKKFLFNDQTKDNLIWTFLSAIPIWTFYEVITYWAFANQYIATVSWEFYPIYCCILFFLIPFIRDGHFYLTHRLLHWGPLYRIAHRTHHNNANPGPWSGMSMHPIEHILYFSGILIHWIIPSHPLIAMFHIFHAGIAPTAGHTGYEKMIFKNGVWIPTGDYNHYLHHKYFECNYAGGNVSFFDELFGTFHDGSDEATEEVMKRLKNKSYL